MLCCLRPPIPASADRAVQTLRLLCFVLILVLSLLYVDAMSTSAPVSFVYNMTKDALASFLEDEYQHIADPDVTLKVLRKTAVKLIREFSDCSSADGSGDKRMGPVSFSVSDISIIKDSLVPVPNLSTCEPHLVLSFLVAVTTAINQNPGGDAVLLKLLGSKVSGRIAHLLRDELQLASPSFAHFKMVVLELVFPPDIKRRFVQIYVDRLQRPDEPLHAFVDTVLEHEKALELGMSELDVISVIMSNLRPCYKNMCPLGSNPPSLSALYVLLGNMENRLFEQSQYYSVYAPPATPRQGQIVNSQLAACTAVAPQGRSPVTSPATVRCANCCLRGHSTRSCPSPPVAFNERCCFRCKGSGHLRSACPSGNGPRL